MKKNSEDQNETPLNPKEFDSIHESRGLDLNRLLREWWVNRTFQNEQLEK